MSFINALPQASANLIYTVCVPTSVKLAGLIVIKLGLVSAILIEVTPGESRGSEREVVTVPPSGSW
jgi:hypothetical protein